MNLKAQCKPGRAIPRAWAGVWGNDRHISLQPQQLASLVT